MILIAQRAVRRAGLESAERPREEFEELVARINAAQFQKYKSFEEVPELARGEVPVTRGRAAEAGRGWLNDGQRAHGFP